MVASMSTTTALYNHPTRTHRGTAGLAIEAGGPRDGIVSRWLFEENGVSLEELRFVIRRRGQGLPKGHTRSGYYGIQEQKEHIQRAHDDYGTLLAYAHEFPCGCDTCMLDDDGGDK
jgi:hypothetical protein